MSYSFDQFIDAPDKSAQERQTDKALDFVREYGEQLRELEEALDGGAGAGEVWDSVRDPVRLAFQPEEPLSMAALVRTDHRLLRKVMLVLGHLSAEMEHRVETARQEFLPALAMFGEVGEDREIHDGEAQTMFGRSISLLVRVWEWCRGVAVLLSHAVHQLGSLAASSRVGPLRHVHFRSLFHNLSRLLGAVISVDATIQNNDAFASFCQVFQRTARRGLEDPAALDTDMDGIARTLQVVEYLNTAVLRPGALLDHVLQHSTADISPSMAAHLCAMVERELRLQYSELVAELDTSTECGRREEIVGVCGLFVLVVRMGQIPKKRRSVTKKVVREVWDLQKRVPLLHLGTHTPWCPGEFLLQSVETAVLGSAARKPARDVQDRLRTALKNSQNTLTQDVQSLYLQLCVWMSRIESEFPVATAGKEAVGIEGTLILQGMHLAYSISTVLRTSMSLHLRMDVPLPKSQVILLCKCVEMLKAIEHTYHRKSAAFASLSSVITEFLAFKIQSSLASLRQRIQNRRQTSDVHIDQLSAIALATSILKGSPSAKRLLLLRHVLSVVFQGNAANTNEREEVYAVLQRLELIASFEEVLLRACDCSWLYWSQPLVHTFFQHVYESPEKAPQLMYVFEALHDVAVPLRSSEHVAEAETLVDGFRRQVMTAFEEHILQPLCQEVETDLRLHIHTGVLDNAATDLSRVSAGGSGKLKDLSIFFKIRPLRFFGSFVSVKRRVEHYLDTTFYNLTALNPSDWKTYEEMRGLAQEKFGLELGEAYLPGQTLEQGLDILEITRNIHIFVGRFAYNLNNNMFVERASASSSRNLNSISIRHVANSIRTHGTGIMNTSVNFVFQFLGRKFFIFSQFLYDDHIKSRLLKDIRYFRDNAAALDNKYPHRRASKFVAGIRKLGLTEGGLSYLDQFRQLITEIGNALGYVRMVRAGGLSYVGDAIRFVPDISAIHSFVDGEHQNGNQDDAHDDDNDNHNNNQEDNTHNNNNNNHNSPNQPSNITERLSDTTRGAGMNLDQVLKELSQKFAEGSDYFRILERVFTAEMQKDQNSHLRNFYIIVPPLTLSYIDHMMQGKDALSKKGKAANFTDDGFALGVAFILKILNQNQDFNSLHWFESVEEYITEQLQQVEDSMREKARARASEEEIQTMKLTTKKLQSQQQEFSLLFYSFAGSRIFFRD